LDVEAAERIGGRGAVLVHVAEVRGVNWVTREEARRQWGDAAGVELEEGAIGA
jgi:hypothetical protein